MIPNFDSSPSGTLPAVIQDNRTGRVLTVGFMNRKAFKKTVKNGIVILYSPGKNRLFNEFESEGGDLEVVSIKADCRGESILVNVHSIGPVCKKGKDTCFYETNERYGYLLELERFIKRRIDKPQIIAYNKTPRARYYLKFKETRRGSCGTRYRGNGWR